MIKRAAVIRPAYSNKMRSSAAIQNPAMIITQILFIIIAGFWIAALDRILNKAAGRTNQKVFITLLLRCRSQ